jgi:putative ABC transport system substrate-binding protein
MARIALLARIACVVPAVALLLFGGSDAAAAEKIGVVTPLCCDFGADTKEMIVAGLKAAGVAPASYELLVQRPGTDRVSLLNSIRKLTAYEVKALITFGGTAAREAAQESRSVPVIFVGAWDPVKSGLVSALDRPGKNVTGVSGRTSLAFLLDALVETTQPSNLGVLYHSDNIDGLAQLAEVKEAAAKRGLALTPVDTRTVKGPALAPALAGCQAVYLAIGVFPEAVGREELEALGKPVITQSQNAEGAGAIFALSAEPEESLAEATKIVARILAGEKPGQVPVGAAKKIAFVVNMQAAQRQGVKIPFGVLSRASRVVK